MKFYLHGNCQVVGIAGMLREQNVNKDLIVDYNEVHLVDVSSDSERARIFALLQESDVIITQTVADKYHGVDFLSTKWLRENKARNASLFTFPSIFFRGYNLSSFALNIPKHVTNYHDVHIADMFCSGIEPEECFDRISSPTFLTPDFIRDEILLCLHELRDRERSAGLDICLSAYLWEHFDEEQLFHTFNHPNRQIIEEVVRQIYVAIGIDPSRMSGGTDYLASTVIPTQVSIARYLGIQTDAVREPIILPEGAFSLLDFIRISYESYAKIGREEVHQRLYSHEEASAYLFRFRRRNRGHHSQILIEGIYLELLHRSPTSNEIIYWQGHLEDRGLFHVARAIAASDEARQTLSATTLPNLTSLYF